MLMWICIALFSYYIYIRLTCGITRSATCLVGRVAVVTGANSGIGYQTALNLASRGCKVIVADIADMEESKKKIMKYTGNTNIFAKYVDLSSLKSVREFAADIIKNEERLDILINNAGIGVSRDNRTEDGLHPVMQVNYFGPFLLTHLLIDILKKSAPSRIVFTSSSLAFFNNLSLNNLNFNDRHNTSFEKALCYCNSKVALLIASDIFAEKLKGSGITSNSVHPGLVTTPILGKTYSVFNNLLINTAMRLYLWTYSKDAWQGAQTQVHVAVSRKLENVTGKYFWDCKTFFKPLIAYRKEFCRKLWEETETYVKLKPDERL